jgi:hypothetical protein
LSLIRPIVSQAAVGLQERVDQLQKQQEPLELMIRQSKEMNQLNEDILRLSKEHSDNVGLLKAIHKEKASLLQQVGWANIRHIFNIRLMNIFDLLFEYSNIIRIFYVIKF